MQHLLHNSQLYIKHNAEESILEETSALFSEAELATWGKIYQKYLAPFSCLHLVSFDILKGDRSTFMGTEIITQWLLVPYEQKLKNGWDILGHAKWYLKSCNLIEW